MNFKNPTSTLSTTLTFMFDVTVFSLSIISALIWIVELVCYYFHAGIPLLNEKFTENNTFFMWFFLVINLLSIVHIILKDRK